MQSHESTPAAGTDRPTGVTILAVLAAIGGVMGLLGSMALFGFGFLGGLYMILGLLTLGFSVAALAFAYGAWQLQPWAWTLGMATFAASAVLTILQVVLSYTNVVSALISLAIAGAVIYYLNQPQIKAAFGRG